MGTTHVRVYAANLVSATIRQVALRHATRVPHVMHKPGRGWKLRDCSQWRAVVHTEVIHAVRGWADSRQPMDKRLITHHQWRDHLHNTWTGLGRSDCSSLCLPHPQKKRIAFSARRKRLGHVRPCLWLAHEAVHQQGEPVHRPRDVVEKLCWLTKSSLLKTQGRKLGCFAQALLIKSGCQVTSPQNTKHRLYQQKSVLRNP